MTVMNLLDPPSATGVENKRKAMQNITITSYPAENVETMITDVMLIHKELQHAHAFDETLTLHVANNLVKAGGEGNWRYQKPLQEFITELESALQIRSLRFHRQDRAFGKEEAQSSPSHPTCRRQISTADGQIERYLASCDACSGFQGSSALVHQLFSSFDSCYIVTVDSLS